MNNIKLAKLIAESAGHFDAICCRLPDELKCEAALHVELLHDAASLLAGDDITQVYHPEDLIHYAPMVQYQQTIGFGGESIGLCHSRNVAGDVTASMIVSTGPFSLALFATPHKVREFILALRELVDECDASAAQHIDPLPLHHAAGLSMAHEGA